MDDVPVLKRKDVPPIKTGAPRGVSPKRMAKIQAVLDQLRQSPGDSFLIGVSPAVAQGWKKVSPEFEDHVQIETRKNEQGGRDVFLTWHEELD